MFDYFTKIKMNDVTAIVKTFLRDDYLKLCVQSLRDTYPDIKIIVGDDGHITPEKARFFHDLGIDYYAMDWDQGICKGRNFLVDKVKTPYVLIGDDDFFYTPEARLQDLRKLMEVSDLAAGAVMQNNSVQHYEGFMAFQGDLMTYYPLPQDNWKAHAGIRYKPCDIGFNFFIAKTALCKEVRWDENIHIMYEHSDFFLRLKGKTVVYAPGSVVKHKFHTFRPTQEYLDSRFSKGDKPYFFEKWKVKRRIDMHGFVDEI
jgi:glycosyltransferase involved in cell wall biosynthesis